MISIDIDGAKVREEPGRIRVTVPGHSWATGIKPPHINGWYCTFTKHLGLDRTQFVYRPHTTR